MTNMKKLLTFTALIVGLHPVTYGYDSIVCNNQITEIEFGIKMLDDCCTKEIMEATRYLKEAIQNQYRTSDETIIKLAHVLASNKVSNEGDCYIESLDKVAFSILNIKAQDIKAQQDKKEQFDAVTKRIDIAQAVMATIIGTLLIRAICTDMVSTIKCKFADEKNDMITTIKEYIKNYLLNNKSSCNDRSWFSPRP